MCIENPQKCISRLIRLLKQNRMFQIRKMKRIIERLEGIWCFCKITDLLENKEENMEEIETKKKMITGLQVFDVPTNFTVGN